jgi:hypothetical protein
MCHVFLTKHLECNYDGMGFHSPCNFILDAKFLQNVEGFCNQLHVMFKYHVELIPKLELLYWGIVHNGR